ncbi:CaiB/BaiF CoA transferase family protein [Chloroflexota bacterium]
MAAALEGIRILVMAWLGPGPFCATLLGDLGAEVINIYEAHAKPGSATYLLFPNSPGFPGYRNCKNISLDLKANEGKEIFFKLAKNTDVIIEGFRPGVAKRMGIDYETINELNPRVVYVSLSGYGQNGPYRDVVGHDINYVSIAGLLGMTGAAGGPPTIPGTIIADSAAGGMSSAVGILAALMAREKTGKGQYVDVSVTDATVELMAMEINPYLTQGVKAYRGETFATGMWPWYNVYETKDGKHISVGTVEPRFFANLCQFLDCEHFIEHQYDAGEKREEIFKYFKETFLTKTRDEWIELLRQKDTCVAPVYSIEELASDPQLKARNMITDMEHPTLGHVKQVGSMFKLSDSPVQIRSWSMSPSQYTEEILTELGYDEVQMKALREAGTIE